MTFESFESPTTPRSTQRGGNDRLLTIAERREQLERGWVPRDAFIRQARARVEAVNPVINAVVTDAPEGQTTAVGPLAGIAFTVKDSIETAGIRTTAGCTRYLSYVPIEDAPMVARIRSLGAVLIGKTNVPPMAGDYDTDNPVFGRTRNPWNLDVTCGGSSGGSAAAVVGGMASFDLASDSAGSLSVPAHFCGAAAHKPTPGIFEQRGHIPPGPGSGRKRRFTQLGIIAATPVDVAYVIRSLAPSIARTEDIPMAGVRVGLWVDDPVCRVDPSISAAVETAGALARSIGCSVATIRSPVDLQVVSGWLARMGSADASPDMPALSYAQQVATARASDPATSIGADLAVDAAIGAAMSHRQWLVAEELLDEVRAAIAAIFDDLDVLICPVAPTMAFPVSDKRSRRGRVFTVAGVGRSLSELAVWPSICAVGRLPQTTVTVAEVDGLPIAVQVLARSGADHLTLAMADRLADALGGRYLPPDRGPRAAFPELLVERSAS